ncbi:MAG: hypothetical protein KDN19_03830 [Verrucomicrobiae bacterium]|nr:hypothetical protein [Verrucomicrobiae bacterium]
MSTRSLLFKLPLIGTTFVLGALIFTSLNAREFTDKQGRKINAEIVSYTDDSVELKMGNNTYGVPIENLSLEDQVYITEWIKANPAATGYRFRLYSDLEMLKRSTKDGIMVQDRLKTVPYEYTLVVYNQSKSAITDVDIRYEIYVNDVVDTRGNRYAQLAVGAEKIDRLQTIPGKLTKKTIPADGKIEFKHEFPTEIYVDRDGGRIDQAASDKVIGVRVRVYKDDKLLWEYGEAEDDKRFAQASWQDEAASEETSPVE